ncbi:MAG: adenylate/guanylate cyclase domain-containing protein [Chloroflexi bacterium]|nr:MAG: adenylate/guanylate cyclase domain-containing protein [Chloroflexota bacterium]
MKQPLADAPASDAGRLQVPTAVLPLAFGVLGLVVAGAALALWVIPAVPRLTIIGDELVGLSYIVAGTIAWLRRPSNRIGPAITGAGITWFIGDFVFVPNAVITALAYALMWLPNLFAAFILLSYPTGRFFSPAARALFLTAVAVSAAQYAVRLFVLDATGDYGCTCRNPFAVLPNVALYDVVMLVTRIVVVLITLVTLVLIVQRWRHASPAGRRQLAPVLFAGAVGLAAFAADITAYNLTKASADAGALGVASVTGTLLVLARTAVPLGLLFGLVRTRLDRALVAQLIVQLGQAPSPERVDEVLAATLHDQTLRVIYWSPAARAYLDGRGRLVEPSAGEGRAIRLVERDGSPLAAIDHDAVLTDDPELLTSVTAALALAVDRGRLETMVRAQAEDSRSFPTGRVTLLYSDIEGSTALLDRLGPRYADLLAEQRRILRGITREHGGREIDSRADEFFAVFPMGSTPLAAAVAIQRRLRDHEWPEGATVKVRIGLHTGEPEIGDEGYVGMDVHFVARLGSAGHGGQILVSQAARDANAGELDHDDLPADFPPPRLAK